MTSTEPPATKLQIYASILFFLVLGLPAVYASINGLIDLWGELSYLPKMVTVYKGLYYVLGAGLGMLTFVFIGVYSKILGYEITQYFKKLLIKILIFSVALALFLPQIIHYTADNYLEKNNYQVCESKSSQWLFVSKIIYTKPGQCDGD